MPWGLPNPSLLGHCDVTFSGGWRINGVPIFRLKAGGFSAGVPTSPVIDREGRQKTDAAGKRQYSPMLQFDDAAARERWNAAIVAALAAAGIDPTAGEGAA